MRAVSSAAGQIEQEIPARRVVLAVGGRNTSFRRRLTLGLAYALRTAGYVPELGVASFAMRLGPGYRYSGFPVTQVTVFVQKKRRSKVRVVITGART